MKGPLKSGGEEKIECFGKGVFSMLVSFREYSYAGMEVFAGLRKLRSNVAIRSISWGQNTF